MLQPRPSSFDIKECLPIAYLDRDRNVFLWYKMGVNCTATCHINQRGLVLTAVLNTGETRSINQDME